LLLQLFVFIEPNFICLEDLGLDLRFELAQISARAQTKPSAQTLNTLVDHLEVHPELAQLDLTVAQNHIRLHILRVDFNGCKRIFQTILVLLQFFMTLRSIQQTCLILRVFNLN